MDRVIALVDYDNQREGRYRGGRGRGRSPSKRDHVDFIEKLIVGITTCRETIESGFVEMTVRLYGGWTDSMDGNRTEAGDMAAFAIRQTGARVRFKRTRIIVELAEAPLAFPMEYLYGTSRAAPWAGLAVSLAAGSASCKSHPEGCVWVEGLLSWAKGRCPNFKNCHVRSRDMFTNKSQKLVDTMIVSDAVTAVHQGYNHVMAVVNTIILMMFAVY